MTKTKRLATRADFRSDAFDLNELVCVELLVAAVERGAPPEQCLRPAAGMFLRERQNRVECLERLLREKQRLAERGESRGEDTRLARVVETCARDILTGVNGGRTLIGRLCEILASPYPGELAAAAARARRRVRRADAGRRRGYARRRRGATAGRRGERRGRFRTYWSFNGRRDRRRRRGHDARGGRAWPRVPQERLARARAQAPRGVPLPRRRARQARTAGGAALATRDDFEALARLFAETASPALATAAADVRARAAGAGERRGGRARAAGRRTAGAKRGARVESVRKP